MGLFKNNSRVVAYLQEANWEVCMLLGGHPQSERIMNLLRIHNSV